MIALAAAIDSSPCLLERGPSSGISRPAISLITLAAKSTCAHVIRVFGNVTTLLDLRNDKAH